MRVYIVHTNYTNIYYVNMKSIYVYGWCGIKINKERRRVIERQRDRQRNESGGAAGTRRGEQSWRGGGSGDVTR